MVPKSMPVKDLEFIENGRKIQAPNVSVRGGSNTPHTPLVFLGEAMGVAGTVSKVS